MSTGLSPRSGYAVTTQGPTLFRRAISLTVGSTLLSGLDCAFEVKKTIKKEPNTCGIKLFNLSASTRKSLEAATVPSASTASTGGSPVLVPCILKAGYVNALSQIFSGGLRTAQTRQDGPTQITELNAGDGDNIGQARLTIALGKGSQNGQALRTILTALGVGQGNLSAALALLSANPAIAQRFTLGACLKGGAADLMTNFCRGAGFEWSIQDGALQITALGQPVAGQSYVISASSGMEGSPSLDQKGILSVKTRLIPGIAPGVVIVVNGKYISGNYRVISCIYKGSTRDTDWGIEIEGKAF